MNHNVTIILSCGANVISRELQMTPPQLEGLKLACDRIADAKIMNVGQENWKADDNDSLPNLIRVKHKLGVMHFPPFALRMVEYMDES